MRTGQRNAGRNWRRLSWTMALVAVSGGGLFLGAGEFAQSDISKYEAILAKQDRVSGEAVVKLNAAGMFSLKHQPLAGIFGGTVSVQALEPFETDTSFVKVKVADADLARFLKDANANPAIAYAEPNYLYHKLDEQDPNESPQEVIPNNPEFSKLWGLKNIGQKEPHKDGTEGKAGADIGATKAWAISKGSRDVVVAVIDTGVDYTHPLLADNIYKNPGESGSGKETNGIDDDGNGFVDDYRGWNFAGVSTNDPMDDNNHGTHCSGTIGANGADGTNIVGVNWTTSILPIKFLTGGGSGSLADAIKAIQYATKMKVNVMSNSWGGGGYNEAMKQAIEEARDAGILFVAAAGNDGMDNDKRSVPTYPSSYQVDNIVSVAASTNKDGLASFSNYGKRLVHIAAPGHRIYSTVPGNRFDTYSGTSMATPHFAGAAALLWSTDKSLSYAQVKDRLLRSRDYVPAFSRKLITGGRLNVYNAINNIFPPAPPEPREEQWVNMTLPAPIESDHPYAKNFKKEWTIEGPANAKYIRVVFGKVDVEAGYDFITVVDKSGAEVDNITGKYDTYNSWYGEGNKLTIRFTSDYDVENWGFQVLRYQVIY